MKAEKLETPSTPDITTYVAERRALLAEATPGPWERVEQIDGEDRPSVAYVQDDELVIYSVTRFSADFMAPRIAADANTIVALRNDEERQLAVIEAADELLQALVDQSNECLVCGVRYKDGISHSDGCEFAATERSLDALTGGTNG